MSNKFIEGLKKQIAQAKEEMKTWPDWMKQPMPCICCGGIGWIRAMSREAIRCHCNKE